MQEISPNWLALAVAVIVKQAIGAFWFSPIAFGPAFARLTGASEAETRARLPKILPVEILAAVVVAFVLVHAVRYAGADDALRGAVVGFFNWLGFVAATSLNGVLYARRPPALFGIETGYWLISLIVMGAILGAWR